MEHIGAPGKLVSLCLIRIAYWVSRKCSKQIAAVSWQLISDLPGHKLRSRIVCRLIALLQLQHTHKNLNRRVQNNLSQVFLHANEWIRKDFYLLSSAQARRIRFRF